MDGMYFQEVYMVYAQLEKSITAALKSLARETDPSISATKLKAQLEKIRQAFAVERITAKQVIQLLSIGGKYNLGVELIRVNDRDNQCSRCYFEFINELLQTNEVHKEVVRLYELSTGSRDGDLSSHTAFHSAGQEDQAYELWLATDLYARTQANSPLFIKGIRYYYGDLTHHIARDLPKAFETFKSSHEKTKDPLATWMLAKCYMYGTGVAKNIASSLKLYKDLMRSSSVHECIKIVGVRDDLIRNGSEDEDVARFLVDSCFTMAAFTESKEELKQAAEHWMNAEEICRKIVKATDANSQQLYIKVCRETVAYYLRTEGIEKAVEVSKRFLQNVANWAMYNDKVRALLEPELHFLCGEMLRQAPGREKGALQHYYQARSSCFEAYFELAKCFINGWASDDLVQHSDYSKALICYQGLIAVKESIPVEQRQKLLYRGMKELEKLTQVLQDDEELLQQATACYEDYVMAAARNGNAADCMKAVEKLYPHRVNIYDVMEYYGAACDRVIDHPLGAENIHILEQAGKKFVELGCHKDSEIRKRAWKLLVDIMLNLAKKNYSSDNPKFKAFEAVFAKVCDCAESKDENIRRQAKELIARLCAIDKAPLTLGQRIRLRIGSQESYAQRRARSAERARLAEKPAEEKAAGRRSLDSLTAQYSASSSEEFNFERRPPAFNPAYQGERVVEVVTPGFCFYPPLPPALCLEPSAPPEDEIDQTRSLPVSIVAAMQGECTTSSLVSTLAYPSAVQQIATKLPDAYFMQKDRSDQGSLSSDSRGAFWKSDASAISMSSSPPRAAYKKQGA